MKKIWLICLCLASLGLVGCFHVPDEDWLPNRNKVNTWNIEKENRMNQTLDLFVDWINSISSERDGINNDEITTKEWEESSVDTDDEIINNEEITENEEMINEEVENEVMEENTISEE